MLLGGGAPAYEIEQGLRFRGGQYLTRTNSTAGNQRTCTLSVWIKKVKTTGFNPIYTANNFTVGDHGRISIEGSFKPAILNRNDTGAGDALLRDVTAWYHLVMRSDTTQSTSTDRVRWYVNGVLQPSASQPPQNAQWFHNAASIHRIGFLNDGGSSYYTDFYLAEMHWIDGSALAPENFGEFDENDVWRPIEVSGLTYGTNGFYMKFDPTATNGLGHDHSGNGNNYTASGFATSGTDTDVMSDTPTNNFATFNPLQIPNGGSPTFAEGNLYYDLNDSGSTISTIGVSSGKWYCEIKAEGTMSQRPIIGLNYLNPTSQGDAGNQVWPGHDVAYAYNGDKWLNYSNSSYGSSWSNGDIIGIALDLDSATQTVTFYRNGTSQGAINLPASGKTWHVSVSSYGADGDNLAFTANFGQRAFEQTQPTGYNSWCTSNLPAPDIADGSQYMNTVTWTGTGASRTIDFGMQPDWIWAKGRSIAANHRISDNVRGGDGTTLYNLCTNNANPQNTDTVINGITSTGVTFKNVNDHPNSSGSTYVGWGWKANGSGSSGSAGSLTSTISSNPSAGFSIVTYEGVPTTGTVGHGLGVVPAMIIVKSYLDNENWYVWHQSFSNLAQDYLLLNYTDAKATVSNLWNNTAPTDTVFSVGSDSATCGDGYEYVAYCFAEVEGYSKFGSYTGNGSSDGAFVYCGFKPAWLLIKRYNTTGAWFLMDSSRNTYNVVDNFLYPNTNDDEDSGSYSEAVDFLSNGFKCRTTSGYLNGSGDSYIFAAFAENPFGGSGVSPATAR